MRILILTAATGGGHDMRANALVRWVARFTDWETQICRPLEQGHGLYRFGVNAYNAIQRNAPRLHHAYFGFLELAGLHRRSRWILGAQRFRSQIESFRPDVIISTHAHLNHAFFDLARETLGRTNVRCVTYCGELGGGYGFSRHWVNSDADLFIGAVDGTVDAAIELGMAAEKAWPGGFMLYPEFFDGDESRESSRKFVIEDFEMDPDDFILLLTVGAVGANNHTAILESLERHGKPMQVVALCGLDEKTFTKLSSLGRQTSKIRLKALGYRQDMARILRAASAVVSRPGTGTTSEAIVSGCPLIMNGIGGIMPQESITVRYATHCGIAQVIHNADEIVTVIDAWMRDSKHLQEMRKNMYAQRPTPHPRDILQRLADLRFPDLEKRRSVVPLSEGVV